MLPESGRCREIADRGSRWTILRLYYFRWVLHLPRINYGLLDGYGLSRHFDNIRDATELVTMPKFCFSACATFMSHVRTASAATQRIRIRGISI